VSVVEAVAPGRVNLIGEHTDYAGGLALPMAIDLGTTVRGTPGGDVVRLVSVDEPEPAAVPLDVTDPSTVRPEWARYVAGVVAELRPAVGFEGEVTTTLPMGGGLSSSAALELAVALALGFDGAPADLAALGQRAEQTASGVPCGIMDQLASACGRDGHALLIDFVDLSVRAVPVPAEVDVWVVHSGQERRLAGSAYAERRAATERATAEIGPLGAASLGDVDRIADPLVARRARHVVTECARVTRFAAALEAGDPVAAGGLMDESHTSLRDDFEVSTDALDALCERLRSEPGVFGARLTGAGFGGCAVALVASGTPLPTDVRGWVVRASAGARRR
jgi:galactokinase